MRPSRHPSICPRCARIVLLVVLMEMAFAGLCAGDQLQWIPLSVCRDAIEVMARLPLLVSFCSQADGDYIELWAIRDVRVAATPTSGLYEIIVGVDLLYRSDRAFYSGEFPVPADQWTFHSVGDSRCVTRGVDLAYVYVYVGGSSFECLARVLGLPCVVGVETIQLPDQVMREIPVCRCAWHCTALWPLRAGCGRWPYAENCGETRYGLERRSF